jgi:hypothetical protein
MQFAPHRRSGNTNRTPNPPAVVMKACLEAAEQAKAHGDYERRRHLAILVFECDDPQTHDVIRAISAATGKPLEPVPHGAVTVILAHVLATRIARALGYPHLPDIPEPGVGKMRMMVFSGGCVEAGPFMVEDAAEVARVLDEEAKRGAASAARIVEEKQVLIRRAVGQVLSKPRPRGMQVVVVFGNRHAKTVSIYRELAALPAQAGFPPELPPGVPVIAVDREEFRRVLDENWIDPPLLDPAKLGTNEVWVATFVQPSGLLVQRMQAVPLARGGVA